MPPPPSENKHIVRYDLHMLLTFATAVVTKHLLIHSHSYT